MRYVMVLWFGAGVAVLVAIALSRWLLVQHHSSLMRSAARRIDDGETCPVCGAVWYEVDRVLSIDGGEVRTRMTLNMDHGDRCDYANWAGL